MCYLIHISTTSEEDFSNLESEYFKVYSPDLEEDARLGLLLVYSNRWCITRPFAACSCHFRHSIDDPEFRRVEDWFPEDEDDIAATQAVYELLERIVAVGHSLDLIDVWEGTRHGDVRVMPVRLSEVPRDHFRFFENTRFEFEA